LPDIVQYLHVWIGGSGYVLLGMLLCVITAGFSKFFVPYFHRETYGDLIGFLLIGLFLLSYYWHNAPLPDSDKTRAFYLIGYAPAVLFLTFACIEYRNLLVEYSRRPKLEPLMHQPPPLPGQIDQVAKAPPSQPLIPPAPTTGERRLYLKVRRAQRTSMLGKPIFTLDARVEPSAEDRALIAKYSLGSEIVYDSKERRYQADKAAEEFATAAAQTSAAGSAWSIAKGLTNVALKALTLRVTIDGLIKGQHIECKDLQELLGAEVAIVQACHNLKAYLDTALTFDGREELVEI
jgi:hypothetical protein